jgi:dolichol-phosphate mannosyltransferase
MARPTLSLVLPVYNEEAVIPILHERLDGFLSKLAVETEVVFVDDGSTDRSLILLRELITRDARYKAISFSRNFGHASAITAGVDYARGEAVVIMDADLQDPPEVIVEMMQRWREGYDVVYGQRLTREGETRFKLVTSRWFYRLLRVLVPLNVPLDTGDFRLMSRNVVLTLRALRETHRFVRGIVSWVGFRQTAVFYKRPRRAAGETKYPLSKMLRLAMDAITSFSVLPLRFATYLGMLISVGSVIVAIWALVEHYVLGTTVPGWTATVVLVALLSSVQLLMIGILGEYIGRIYEQVKGRPLYVVSETLNLPRALDTDELDPTPRAAPPPIVMPAAQPPLLTPQSAPTLLIIPGLTAPAAQASQAQPPSPPHAAPSDSPTTKDVSAAPPAAPASPPSPARSHAPLPQAAAASPVLPLAHAPLSHAPAAPTTSSAPPRRSMPPPVPPPRASKMPMKGTLMGITAPPPSTGSDSAPESGKPPSPGIDVPVPSVSPSPPGTPASPEPGVPMPPQLLTAPMPPIPSPPSEPGEEPGEEHGSK